MMLLSGRLGFINMPDGRKIWPAVAITDVSQSLDILSQVPGSMLVRGPQVWEGRPAPSGWQTGDWLTLTFPDPGVSRWAGNTYYQAAEQVDIPNGATVEIEIRMDRTNGQRHAVAIADPSYRSVVFIRQDDNNDVLYRYSGSPGTQTVIQGGTIITGQYRQTLTLSVTPAPFSPGTYQHPVASYDGMKSRMGGLVPGNQLDLLGLRRPFFVAAPSGPASLIYARARITKYPGLDLT